MEAEEQQPPASPGEGPPVDVKECLQEILRWTLACSLKGEVDVALSKDYCFRLLQDDDPPPPPSPSPSPSPSLADNLSQGVPSYPLYKHIAASLYHSLSSTALVSMPLKFSTSEEHDSLKPKEDEWTAVIMEYGSKLLNMLKAVDFELHVQEPFFSQIHYGHKSVEGRCASGNYNRVEAGDCILFNKCLLLKVQYIHRYISFREMLEAECLQNVLPGVATFEEGTQVYRKFYSEEKERSNGVLAICVAKPYASLHSYMANILLVLGYAGIRRMLNMGHTIGSIPEALPPPPSILVSSFLTPHNPHVQGSMLTDGARALAKHIDRSSAKYWGNFRGSDTDKNRHALDIISGFIVDCCWLNTHIVPPHGAVFEVRVAEGYGARWSEDGLKFIGFLEPYMVDGHQKGWKH